MLGTIPLPAPPLLLLAPVGAPPLPVTLPVLFDAEDTPDDTAATADDALPLPTLTPADTALLLLTLLPPLLLLLTLPPVCDTTFEVALLATLLFELLLFALLLANEEGLTFLLLVIASKDEWFILFATALLEFTPLETEFTADPLLLIALLDETLKIIEYTINYFIRNNIQQRIV